MREIVLLKDDIMQLLKRYGLILDKCVYETLVSEIDNLITFTMSVRTYTEHYCKDCKKCDSCGETSDDLITCDWFESKPEIKTVADKIRNMTYCELEMFLETVVDGCINYENNGCKDCKIPHSDGTCHFMEFLKTNVSESNFDFKEIEDIAKDHEDYYTKQESMPKQDTSNSSSIIFRMTLKDGTTTSYGGNIDYEINGNVLTIKKDNYVCGIYNFDRVSHIDISKNEV